MSDYTQYLSSDGTIFNCSNQGLIELNLIEIFKDPRFSRVIEMYVMSNKLTQLIIPSGIQKVCCSGNQLTELTIPEGVKEIWCAENQLMELIIPEGVQNVYCSYNQLTKLTLPKGVQEVWCSGNQITKITLPEGVQKVYCGDNRLTELTLPEGVKNVYCRYNLLTQLTIPEGVQNVECQKNRLTKLTLLEGIQYVKCGHNFLTQLTLPEGVKEVECFGNQLTELSIPAGVKLVDCYDNQLTQLIISQENNELQWLDCENNELNERPMVPNGCTLLCNIKPKPIPVTSIEIGDTTSEYRCIYCHSDSLEECSEMWGKKVRGVYLHSCCKKIICEPALLQWLNECENNNRFRECMHCKQQITAYSIFK